MRVISCEASTSKCGDSAGSSVCRNGASRNSRPISRDDDRSASFAFMDMGIGR